MHNLPRALSVLICKDPMRAISETLSKKKFRASRGGEGLLRSLTFSARPPLPHFFHAPAAGDTGTPLFKILDPPLHIEHMHACPPHYRYRYHAYTSSYLIPTCVGARQLHHVCSLHWYCRNYIIITSLLNHSYIIMTSLTLL